MGPTDIDSTEQSDGDDDNARDRSDVEAVLQRAGFDAERTFLTRRQAAVLVMRENVTGLEARARDNVEKARETVAFAEALSTPVRVEIPAGTDLYDAPDLVFDACDEANIKVDYNAPELMKLVTDRAGSAVDGREVLTPVFVSVTSDGSVRTRQP